MAMLFKAIYQSTPLLDKQLFYLNPAETVQMIFSLECCQEQFLLNHQEIELEQNRYLGLLSRGWSVLTLIFTCICQYPDMNCGEWCPPSGLGDRRHCTRDNLDWDVGK